MLGVSGVTVIPVSVALPLPPEPLPEPVPDPVPDPVPVPLLPPDPDPPEAEW
jgi:hypothetical protein